MKKIVRLLFGGIILPYALSTIAMDDEIIRKEGSPNTKKAIQQPLKFKVDPQTGNVEDAEESYLIKDYCSVVGDLYTSYSVLKDEARSELKDLEEALSKMSPNSDEHFATGIYRNKLVSKVSKFEKKISDIIEQQAFFRKFLTEIYKGVTPSNNYGICTPVPNYKLISTTKFNEMESLDFSSSCDPSGITKLGKHCIELKINCQFSSHDIPSEFYKTLQTSDRDDWKLITIQRVIFAKSKLLYHLSTKTEHKLSPQEWFLLAVTKDIAQENQKTATQILKEEIDELIHKAEGIYIPKLAPKYYFTKAVMAFCEEVERHRAMQPKR